MTVIGTASPTQTMDVRYDDGERYEIAIRNHQVLVDQPLDVGGNDLAPTPTELFVASLAGCVAFYAGRYLSRHGITRDGLGVQVAYRMADRPARVAGVELTVTVPDALPVQQRPALQAVIKHCTVHNSLTDPPTVHIELAV
jgi:putative redox protein